VWRRTTEKEALIGVGMTGICNGSVLELDLKAGAKAVKEENKRVADLIGIKPAARTTTIKPSGSTSCVVGTSSGIHPWYSEFYIRNMQCAIGDDLYNYFIEHRPGLIKDMDQMPGSAVIGIPQMAPPTAILRENESAVDMLERVKRWNKEWVRNGHRKGSNTNNVSATVYIKQDEWETVGEWMWDNRDIYNGLSVLPFNGGTYKDAPFMPISRDEYFAKLEHLKEPLDLTLIKEDEDHTDLAAELACSGDNCEIR
jgi:ribonucleoside-diphosphate reductase alpha chain